MPTTSVELVKDYHQRILDWYEKYLKADEEEEARGVDRVDHSMTP
jgi:hypothetical protein